jgi:hypothetical protein
MAGRAGATTACGTAIGFAGDCRRKNRPAENSLFLQGCGTLQSVKRCHPGTCHMAFMSFMEDFR